ncbi:hypothetical protein [Parapedobacter indicus]|uniref:hypothetical protein n=1 Tax=Parapedobacter indicus TaxID=1477437 RepID=UPI001160293C|nr:hypothetical protein [Parapedobacter indicus]
MQQPGGKEAYRGTHRRQHGGVQHIRPGRKAEGAEQRASQDAGQQPAIARHQAAPPPCLRTAAPRAAARADPPPERQARR